MQYSKDSHRRRSIRLKRYDYSQTGAYFVTVCTWKKECLFGDVIDNALRTTDYGRMVHDEWLRTAEIRCAVRMDEFIVMPNHFHGIVIIDECSGTARRAPTSEQFAKPVSGSLASIIRSFKSAVTKRINEIRNAAGVPVWQRNYYEHIIRDNDELNRIRNYIAENPLNWAQDEDNPEILL